MKKSPLFVIFTTVLMDLVGFGMVIPLVGVYGRHYGASPAQLAILGGIYSLVQFFFAPFWGRLSDRIGRRPVLLISLLGSTSSYLLFGLAQGFSGLIVSRALGGLFAANISAAQAYIADVTTVKDRAKGMGLIGAAFGIGFTLGPPLGGIAAARWGLGAPGFIAAAICGLNAVLAWFRLPESLSPELRERAKRRPERSLMPLNGAVLASLGHRPVLALWIGLSFVVTFAFSNMEQTFSLLFQARFGLETAAASEHTGWVLMWAGIVSATVQGTLIRKLVPRFGEKAMLALGLTLNALGNAIFPWGLTPSIYFALITPLSLGSALVNPTLSALISKSSGPEEQGAVLGLSQGLSSLARASGPFCGLLLFSRSYWLPFALSASLSLAALGVASLVGFSRKEVDPVPR